MTLADVDDIRVSSKPIRRPPASNPNYVNTLTIEGVIRIIDRSGRSSGKTDSLVDDKQRSSP
jgi:hypothetical protein